MLLSELIAPNIINRSLYYRLFNFSYSFHYFRQFIQDALYVSFKQDHLSKAQKTLHMCEAVSLKTSGKIKRDSWSHLTISSAL